MPANNPRLIAELRARAKSLGFDAFGITAANARPDLPEKLEAALERGWHGDMAWMADTAERRGSPTALWEGVRSIIMLGLNYGPDSDPLALLDAARSRLDLGLCAQPRLSRHHQGQAQGAGRPARAGAAAAR